MPADPDDPGVRARTAPARTEVVPNANSPVLLTHLLEMVARGVRTPRALQEALGVDGRTVRYYLQAGAWLGFLDDGDPPLLTPDGLGYVYAGDARPTRYADAARRVPFVAALLTRAARRKPNDTRRADTQRNDTQGTRAEGRPSALPSHEDVAAAIRAADPDLAEATVSRRVSAVRGLLAPLFDSLAEEALADAQLALPLAQRPLTEAAAPLASLAGRSFSPDIYRFVFIALLDHGELTLGHVRGLLDAAGAPDVPIGAYVDLALSRGDVVRVEEHLVATPGAIARRDLADATQGIILSDAGWRAHLEASRARALERDRLGAAERSGGRYRLWDQRLFGHVLRPERLDADLKRVLRDRGLRAFPCAASGDAGAPAVVHSPFLRAWETPGQLTALPPSLAQLWEDVAGVNRRLRNARHRPESVGTPTLASRPVAVHGGLLHPGEATPRSVPDRRSLRLRLVQTSPYVTLVIGLLWLHRRGEAVEIRQEQGTWTLRHRRRRLGELLDALDGLLIALGHHACRRRHGGLSAGVLLGLLERLGLVLALGSRAVLDDGFFRSLTAEHDEAALAHLLGPLADRLAAALEPLGRSGSAWDSL